MLFIVPEQPKKVQLEIAALIISQADRRQQMSKISESSSNSVIDIDILVLREGERRTNVSFPLGPSIDEIVGRRRTTHP